MLTAAAGRRPSKSEASDLPAAPNSPVLTIIRQLIAESARSRAGRSAGASLDDGGDKLILLNVEVDGVRCMLVKQPTPTAPCTGPRTCLSPREREITRLIAKGYPNKAIADVLEISTWTVCTHLRRIFSKFGVSSRAALVAQYLERAALSEN